MFKGPSQFCELGSTSLFIFHDANAVPHRKGLPVAVAWGTGSSSEISSANYCARSFGDMADTETRSSTTSGGHGGGGGAHWLLA